MSSDNTNPDAQNENRIVPQITYAASSPAHGNSSRTSEGQNAKRRDIQQQKKFDRLVSSPLRQMELTPEDNNMDATPELDEPVVVDNAHDNDSNNDPASESNQQPDSNSSNSIKEQSPAPRSDTDEYGRVKPLAQTDFTLGDVSTNAAYANAFVTSNYGEVHDWTALMAAPNPEHPLPVASPEMAAKLREELGLPDGKYKDMHILNAHITLAKTGRVATAWDVEKFAAWWDGRPVDFAMAPTAEELRQKKEAKEKERLAMSKQAPTEGLDFDAIFAEMNGTPAKSKTSVPASSANAAVDANPEQHRVGSATSYARPPAQACNQPTSVGKTDDIPQPWELEEAAARAADKRRRDRVAAEKARAMKKAEEEDE